jgi:hypothetical protein
MAYIGNQPTTAAFVTDLFSGDGTTTAFTMSVSPANTASVLVAISGVVQSPDTYSTSGLTLTFSAAPPAGTGNISVRYLGVPATNVTTTAYRTVTEFTATASQTTFSVPSYTVGYIDVYRNGVRLGAADYTATNGTTVVLANAATLGDLVTTESFYVSSVLNAIPAAAGQVGAVYLANGAASQSFLDVANLNGTGALLTPSGNTAQRPSSPIVGMQRWNTTIGGMEVYIGTGSTGWQTIASTAYSVDYLILAGGGGGSYGGGGAGGLLQGSSISVSPGTSYTVTIGAGGTASSSGSDSSVFSLTAIGGGGGYVGGTGRVARSGGSGAGTQYSAGNSGVAGSGTAGQGNNGGTGGDGVSAYTSGGGGGGAGAVGASTSTTAGAAGGVGLASSISGSSVFYAGGGGGTTNSGSSYGTGGSGGGGNATGGTGTSGTANTGGGAGAGASVGGSGGSGIVIIRYLGTVQRATGGTVTISGGYVIHTFTSSSTYIA